MKIHEAHIVWNSLRGLVCLYKPPEHKVRHIRNIIMNKICAELNEMECRPPIEYVAIEGNPSEKLDVIVRPNLADDPKVVGPRYLAKDMMCSWSNYLGPNTSGVLLLGLRSGTKIAKRIRENYPTRAYRIKGMLGMATDNYYKTGRVVEKSTFRHIKPYNIERLLAHMQSAHQRKMFELSGVDIQSQSAYELAIQGPIRPVNSKLPIIYGIKCVQFESPEFTIEIQCVNEYETYLMALIQEIGMKLHSTAHCTGITCIRHSYFTAENALLHKNWNLQNLITNMQDCNRIMESHENILQQESVALTT